MQKKFVNRDDKSTVKTFAMQIEGIPQQGLTRKRRVKECMRRACPADRKGSHKTKDCHRQSKTDESTGSFPKAKEYQKMKIGACDFEENQQNIHMEGSDSEELRDSASERSKARSTSQSASENSSDMGENWWESS